METTKNFNDKLIGTTVVVSRVIAIAILALLGIGTIALYIIISANGFQTPQERDSIFFLMLGFNTFINMYFIFRKVIGVE